MSIENKKYRLLKDLPYVKAGCIYEKCELGYHCDKGEFIPNIKGDTLKDYSVENNPEWFELVTEPIEEIIKVGKMSCREGEEGYGEMKWNLQFKTNKYIHYDNAIKLCNILEQALNTNTVYSSQPISRDTHLHTDTVIGKGKDLGWEILSFKQDSKCEDLWTEFNKGWWSRNRDGESATTPYSTEGILRNKLYSIHSVKRLSDNSIWSIGDKSEYGSISMKEPLMKLNVAEIKSFGIKDNQIWAYGESGFFIAPLNNLHLPTEQKDRCGICGGDTVLIRGKYPNTSERSTCPTCTTERLEQVQEISSPGYGKTYQA